MPEAADYSSLMHDLAALDAKDNRRRLTLLEHRDGKYATLAGRRLLNVSSNDYLGLAGDAELQSAFYSPYAPDRLDEAYGLGASSSRLLTGNHAYYAAVETKLAAMFGREAALVLNSGYHANLGLLPALLGPQDIVFSDKLNHASLIDGVRLSGAKLFRYPHLDYQHLEHLLNKHRAGARRAVIVSESVFSMDGDCADLRRLVELKQRHSAWLYVDEAHAFGVFGDRGLGLAETQGVITEIDFLVGTFGKALAALGAYVVGDRTVVEYLINTTRPFIFTTALPPVMLHWIGGLLEQLPAWRSRRVHVLALAEQLRQECQACGLTVLGESQIVPVMIGDNDRALRSARVLREAGFLLMAVRPPTVPVGTSRLRISLSAAMDWDDIKSLPDCIRDSL